ncbi:Protein aardvark [Gracilariopsis chorda]|uniref:Protein aardvark n=1 Tax=Gracilariopsis chorda TaxID=448386 RepID=A0A2V3J6Q1_9FLOR|nr:Protein aardvark [Gracilariopsis chorda]|eukprot:PXF50101.1 Protein aardvark [Gracilariopsis chorda]
MSSISSHSSSPNEPPPHSTAPFHDADDPHSFSSATGALDLSEESATITFVRATLANPKTALHNSAARASFIRSVLGDQSLAVEADTDAPLLRQLQTRAAIIVREISTPLQSTDDFDTDALVALLALLAVKWPLLLDIVEQHGATLLVKQTILRWQHRVSIISRCLTALRAFTVTDAMRRRVMFDGIIDLTLQLMDQYPNSRRIQDRALPLMANIAFGCPHRKRRITRQGAIKAIIQAMTTFSNDQNIQLRAALTIRNLTHQTQVNQYIAGNQGAVEAIASTILRFRGSTVNPELRFQCIMALESLCHQHQRNRQRLIEFDATPLSFPNTISSITTAPLSNSSNQQDEDDIVDEHGDLVVDEEQVLISDVTPHFSHGAALCPGKIVSNLVASPSVSSSTYSDRSPTSPLPAKGPPLDNEKQNAFIAEQEEQPSIKKPSVVRAIIHAMRRDPNDAMLLETALSVLTLIALHNVQVQHTIGHFGGIQVAVAAIKRHPKHPAVATKASALIRCLCLQEANRRLITSGLPVLISALKDHRNVPDVVREVASALSNAVFESEKNRAWVVNKGGVPALIQAMSECGSKDVMVLDAGVCALRNFVDSSYSGALSAVKDGAVQAALDALDRTKDASTAGECIVQEQAVLFLVDVAALAPQTKKRMCDLDAADWIENALAKLKPDRYPDLHAAADNLLSELSEQESCKFGKSKPAAAENQSGSTKLSTKPPRGIFGGFLLPKRSATTTDVRKRFGGRSMPLGGNRNEPGRKGKRLSTRLRFTTHLS